VPAALRASVPPLPALASAAVAIGATALVALHVLPASRGFDWPSEPLSEYAFAANAWVFDLAVTALAAGLAVLVSALVLAGCVRRRSAVSRLLSACAVCLVLVVVFPEHDADGAVRTAGRIHWLAAMLAFGGLAVAPILLGRHNMTGCSRMTSLARRTSAGTVPGFVVVLVSSLLRATSFAVPPWCFGLGERALVAAEFALAGILTAWAWRGCRCIGGENPSKLCRDLATEGPDSDLPCLASLSTR
jgi:hypothetical membrane protein